MLRTRIKICGLTREQDVDTAVEAGVDALGFVFYAPSPRFITAERAEALVRRVPPFVSTVGLFVNASEQEIGRVLAQVPLGLLQFHGDETAADCERYGRPYVKAARMAPGFDLRYYSGLFPRASALLLDAFVEGYGGGGKVFDWSLIPPNVPHPLVLSGGLNAENVAAAVSRVRPYAVDVSSGVEQSKGVKDSVLIHRFVEAVRQADASSASNAPVVSN